jgi:hypothetical protein
MSDIIKDATQYRIKQIELAEARYYETLIKTLDKIDELRKHLKLLVISQ